ncbi:MAG: hypothetical protein IJW63_00100 [Lachnospiraceae bacterium]|nr:hypothetical protein [Lachnospiraceae bacterium]
MKPRGKCSVVFCDGDEASARRQEHRPVLAQKDVHLADGICRPLIRARFAKHIWLCDGDEKNEHKLV